MNIYINDEAIDFTLENEQTLYEVLHSLETELINSGGHILSILVDKKSIQYPDESIKEIPIHSVADIHIEADNSIITRIKQLQVILEYLHIIESASNSSSYLKDIQKEEISFIVEYIDTLYASEHTTPTSLKQLLLLAFNKIGLTSGEVLETSKEAGIIFTHVRLMLSQKILLLMNPSTHWIEINKLVKKSMQTILTIVEFIYSSQEIIAISLLGNCIETYIQWIHILATPPLTITQSEAQLEWKQQHEHYTRLLRAFFEELSAAMEVKDWITVSDLIEYEICPKTHEYIKLIEGFYPLNTDD